MSGEFGEFRGFTEFGEFTEFAKFFDGSRLRGLTTHLRLNLAAKTHRQRTRLASIAQVSMRNMADTKCCTIAGSDESL